MPDEGLVLLRWGVVPPQIPVQCLTLEVITRLETNGLPDDGLVLVTYSFTLLDGRAEHKHQLIRGKKWMLHEKSV